MYVHESTEITFLYIPSSKCPFAYYKVTKSHLWATVDYGSHTFVKSLLSANCVLINKLPYILYGD